MQRIFQIVLVLLFAVPCLADSNLPTPPPPSQKLACPTAVGNLQTGEYHATGQLECYSTERAAEAAGFKKHCCKHCGKGKPCGNTCISRNKTCHTAPGCACG